MEIVMNSNPLSLRLFRCRWLLVLVLGFAATGAMAQADPPGRVAALSHVEGTVAFAPAGQTEWADAAVNRPITRGDRLWTDPGARAELHLGSAALHMDSRTFVEVVALDDDVLQLSLNEGVVNARVRQLESGENFEIATPQLAFRATQPGDYRIDVDPASGTTRIAMRSGAAIVQGAGGGFLQLHAGQQIAFTGRDLAPTSAHVPPVDEGFDRWAAGRNHSEDLSISARYVPRDVVGYQQLDANGVWTQDPSYGAVWYPRVTVGDWAPYRYGRWDWVAPWGWTWIDNAPWGFAPFHYGRWAQIGSRWAWVPGRIGPRPVYSPALVVFVGGHGGGANWNLSVGSGPGIAWFPLAPGEAWRPTYRTSPIYLRNVNRYFPNYAGGGNHLHQRRADAITAVRADDFNRGRPVHRHWSRVNPDELARLQFHAQPTLPEPRRWEGNRGGAAQLRAQPQVQQAPAPAIIARPQPQFQPFPGVVERREPEDRARPGFRSRDRFDWQQRAQDEQRSHQMQRQAEQMQQERARRDAQVQQMQQQQAQRDHQGQQMHQAQRLQQMQQQQMQRQREDHERQQRAQREQGLQQQQMGQERFQRQQEWQQQRAMPQHRQPPLQMIAPAIQPPPAANHRGEGRERGQERGWRGQQHGERAARGEGEGGRGWSRGQRSFN
jgi:hypothetical protein